MKHLYPICVGDSQYRFGLADETETDVGIVCPHDCSHVSPIEASDCFRKRLLKKKPTAIVVQAIKCCHPKCANSTTRALNYGYDFQFALCSDHQNLDSVKRVCGFGFPLVLQDKE